MESEFWPIQIEVAKQFGIRIIAVNARLSQKSFYRWRTASFLNSTIFQSLDLVLATNKQQGDRFTRLGAKNVTVCGNLKRSAPRLVVDLKIAQNLSEQIANRPVWVAASTHIGEDVPIIEVTRGLLGKFRIC